MHIICLLQQPHLFLKIAMCCPSTWLLVYHECTCFSKIEIRYPMGTNLSLLSITFLIIQTKLNYSVITTLISAFAMQQKNLSCQQSTLFCRIARWCYRNDILQFSLGSVFPVRLLKIESIYEEAIHTLLEQMGADRMSIFLWSVGGGNPL